MLRRPLRRSRISRQPSFRAGTTREPIWLNSRSGTGTSASRSIEDGPWYKSIERGMKAALHMARASDGYVFSDRGTWIHFKNKGDLEIMVEGDKRMFNQYAVILVNADKHPNVKKDFGQQFIDWLVSPEGQKAIADYKINGEQLFFPNATDPNA